MPFCRIGDLDAEDRSMQVNKSDSNRSLLNGEENCRRSDSE
jgi:hypothetical protein